MHLEFMQQAIDLAVNNVESGRGGPYGAIIVKHQQVIACGTNQVTINNDPTAHAEITAIRLACNKLTDFQLQDCILYTSCEPCPMCLGAIYWARLQKVFYACTRQDADNAGFDDSFIYDQISVPPSARTIPMLHLKGLTSHAAFDAWLNFPDKINY